MLNKQGLFSQNDRYRQNTTNPTGGTTPIPSAAPAEPVRSEPARSELEAIKARAATVAEEQKGSRLIVGPDIKLKGAEITDCDTLVVEGRVEASMDARVIQIAENGSYHGTVGVDNAEIRGRFEGEMTARKQIIIRPGGKVTGKIRYGKIIIEDGGEISGDVGTLGASKAVSIPTAKPAAQAAGN
jgi:cytoskeletal protein CcmA (bactofilin family)